MLAKSPIKTIQRSFERLETRTLLTSDVYISEFVASNDSTLADEDGDYPDWVEIYNPGPDKVDMSGWHLTDDSNKLRKWSFPAETLEAGRFLVVYLSDKDRALPNHPLHANFKLRSDGEYLAITKDTSHFTVEVVSEFAPEFPSQLTDVSYGIAQSVSIETLADASTAARFNVPTDDSLGSEWTQTTFDDSSWSEGTASLGYQLTVPGFTVQDAKSSSRIVNLTEAIDLLEGTNQSSETIEIAPMINFLDRQGGGGTGNFSNDAAFPNDTSRNDNDFAIRATGTIVIPSTGTWTFGINSDDGARLVVDGKTVINDDTLHAPRTTMRRQNLSAGRYEIELIFFERGGGAEVELFAAPGRHSSFNSRFRLIGDTTRGGLRVETSPTGDITRFSQLYETDIESSLLGRSSTVYVRIPFDVDDLNSIDSLSLQVHYDDGYAAYLNGQEIVRRNAPDGTLGAQSRALRDRPQSESQFVETLDISSHLGLLQQGQNVLAIRGLNYADDDSEFVLRVQLAEVTVSQGDRAFFAEPTPFNFNTTTGVDGFLADEVTFSHQHGFYDNGFSLTMTSTTPNSSIRYTLDGSEPTEQNGTSYVGPVRIDQTSTVRARAFKDGLDPSNMETATYLFLDDVLEQSPEGQPPENFPTRRSINGQVLDYGMDPAIVSHRTWGRQLMEALTQVPTMSIVMDIDDLLGSREGIYTHANSHGKAWERPASLELIHPNGDEGFQVETGIRIRGGFSRSSNNPKHAFRLFFREEYGDSKLEYPLFGEEGADEFDKIDLRTTQNYSWSFQGGADNAFVRDVFARDLQREIGQPYTRSRYYHLYVNGQYWGLFQTQERAEARFAATYFGGRPEDYDVVKSAGNSGGYQNEATDGNLDAYRRLADYFYQGGGLSDENVDDYWRAQGMNPDGTRNPNFERLLDVDNLIDYMLITYYTGDRDGPVSRFVNGAVNNYFGIFNRENPDGFKFFEHDSEHTLDRGFADIALQLTSSGRQFNRFNPLWMHEQLASSNSDYQLKFADAVYEHLTNDGIMTTRNAQSLLQSRANEIDMAIIAESARWGDAKVSSPRTKADWQGAVRRARNFLDGREDVVIGQFRSLGWLPTSGPPVIQVNGRIRNEGTILDTDFVELTASRGIDFSERLIRARSSWHYLDDGTNQGTAWRALDFDDSQWESGRGELGYGDGNERTKLSFGSNSNNKHITTYFRRTFNLDDAAAIDALRMRLNRDDGAVVYLNGEELLRSNMPEGTIRYRTTARQLTQGGDESAFFEFEVDADLLRTGENIVAVEIHQISRTSSDISFDLELHGGSYSSGQQEIYYTVDGTDPRLAGGGISPSAMKYGDPFRLPKSVPIITRWFDGRQWSAKSVTDFDVEVTITVPGDINGDQLVDDRDIDLLAMAIARKETDQRLDLNGDGATNEQDFSFLIEEILDTTQGDTDLDGDVDFDDFGVLAASFGQREVGWARGDFDLDDVVDFDDFVALSTNFGDGTMRRPRR